MFREEVANIFFSKNTFTCQTILGMKKGLGLEILPYHFTAYISSLALTWASLGHSTVQAEKVLGSLPGLKSLDVFISFNHVLRVGSSYGANTDNNKYSTSQGVEAFQHPLDLQDSNGSVRVRVFEFFLCGDDNLPLASECLLEKHQNVKDPKRIESSMNSLFTDKLILKKGFIQPLLSRATTRRGTRREKSDPKLMEKENELKLEEILIQVRAEEEQRAKNFQRFCRLAKKRAILEVEANETVM